MGASVSRRPMGASFRNTNACMRSFHLNAAQAGSLKVAGAAPACVIAVSPTCPACIALMQVLESMCHDKDAALQRRNLYTMDIDAVRSVWPALAISHVPRAMFLHGTAAPRLVDGPLQTQEDVQRLARRLSSHFVRRM